MWVKYLLKMMKKMKNDKLIYIALGIVLLLLSIFYVKDSVVNYIIDKYSNKTDTITVSDTIRYADTLEFIKEKPIPQYIEKIKTDTVFSSKGDSIFLDTENKTYKDTICQQKDTAIVTNYISGINANLDSTKVQLRITKEVITNTVEVTKYIPRKKTFLDRFSFGPSVTAGYDPLNKQWGVLVGVSVTFDIK